MYFLALWEFQARHDGELPDDGDCASELQEIADSLFAMANVHKKVLKTMPEDILEYAIYYFVPRVLFLKYVFPSRGANKTSIPSSETWPRRLRTSFRPCALYLVACWHKIC